MEVAHSETHKKSSIDDNMIPLINIVFLMLIFFMVAGHISQSTPVKVSLPHSISDSRQQETALVVLVGSNGELGIENKTISATAAKQMIEKKFTQAKDKEALTLLLKIDGNLPVSQLRPILRQMKQIGIKRVSIATQQMVN